MYSRSNKNWINLCLRLIVEPMIKLKCLELFKLHKEFKGFIKVCSYSICKQIGFMFSRSCVYHLINWFQLITLERSSIVNANKSGERGQPCQVPLVRIKLSDLKWVILTCAMGVLYKASIALKEYFPKIHVFQNQFQILHFQVVKIHFSI